MPLRAIVGHHHVVDLLARAMARDGLPPSLILTGPDGVGKRRVAIAVAQVLNCLAPVRRDESAARGTASHAGRLPIDACGTCSACRRIAKGSHPDVLVVDERGVHPEVVDVEVKPGSVIIPVGVARELIKLAGYRPYEAKRRFLIFDPADAMEVPAQNALLKVLEEPPPATVFVLVTSQPDLLLPTVRSRCPQIRFGPLTVAEITEVLTRERKIAAHEARAAAVLASGSAARAIEAASDETSEARTQALEVLHDAAAVRDRQGLMVRMQGALGVEKRQGTAAAEREQVSLALRAMSALLRDLAMLAESEVPSRSPRATAGLAEADGERGQSSKSEVGLTESEVGQGVTPDLANADLSHDLERLSPSFGRDRAVRAYAAVDRALAALRSNVSPKLVVDWLAFQI